MVARKPVLPRGIRRHSRAGGRSVFEVRVSDAGGAQHSRTFETLDAATAWQTEYQQGRRRGAKGDLSGQRIRFADYARGWAERRVEDEEIRLSTAAVVDSHMRAHIIPALGGMRLADIERRHINALTKGMISDGLAPATALKSLQIIAAVLKAAVIDKHIATNPADGARRPTIPDEEARFLTHDELIALEAAMNPWWRLAVPFMAECGLRIGEVAALRCCDITVDVVASGSGASRKTRRMLLTEVQDTAKIVGGTVHVRGTVAEVPKRISGEDTQRRTHDPKTRAGSRTVPTLSATTCRRLVEQVRERGQDPAGPLFYGRMDAPMSPRSWRTRVWRPAVEAAELAGNPTPHALRHTAVSIWIESGVVDTVRLAAYAGHRSVTVLLRIYGHLLPHDASDIREALDRRHQRRADQG